LGIVIDQFVAGLCLDRLVVDPAITDPHDQLGVLLQVNFWAAALFTNGFMLLSVAATLLGGEFHGQVPSLPAFMVFTQKGGYQRGPSRGGIYHAWHVNGAPVTSSGKDSEVCELSV
jgi:hypothetical protein